MKEQIVSKKGAKPSGAYSPGIRAGDFVFVSGQGPLDPNTAQIVGTTIQEQTRRTLDNVNAILEGAGCTMDDVVKSTVHLLDIKMFADFNKTYAEYFKDPKPARTTTETGLWNNILVEIDVIAYKPKQ
jgi:2-iminobutanoate/2-iminopropanoate deaminase